MDEECQERSANFKQKTVLQLISKFFQDGKTKMNNEALVLITEVLTIFVAEATTRAVVQTKKEGMTNVTVDQFEKILPQLFFGRSKREMDKDIMVVRTYFLVTYQLMPGIIHNFYGAVGYVTAELAEMVLQNSLQQTYFQGETT